MKAEVLGLQMQVSVYAVRSCPPPERMQRVLEGLVKHIGMTTGGLEPKIWHYPFGGMGGEGETFVQPFTAVQPLMESLSAGIGLAAGDTWREHGGSYIIIASCRPYSAQAVAQFLGQAAGLVVDFAEARTVSLLPKPKQRRAWCGGGGS